MGFPVQNGVFERDRYGAASRFDFDNPQKWVTKPEVPLLDEHEMTNDEGRPVAYVGKEELEQIAANNNRRVVETGDPATLILGHTSDDPRAPEKPAKGFVVNYRVKPYRRDPKTGQVLYAIFGDYKVRPKNASIIEEYPRRSVELWWNRKELDPVALLGGTTPERDLGVVVRYGRLARVALLGGTTPERGLGVTLKYSRRGEPVLRYEMGDAMNCGPGRYAAGDDQVPPDDEGDDFDPEGGEDFGGDGDDFPPDEGDDGDIYDSGDEANDADEDPVVAKIFQSKTFQTMLEDAVVKAIQDVLGPEGGPGGAGGDGFAGEAPVGPEGMPPPSGGGMPPPGGGGMGAAGGMPPVEEESREEHGDAPVRFESTGFPGPMSGTIPTFGGGAGGRGKPYSRNSNSRSADVNRNGKGNRTPAAPAAPRTDPKLLRELRDMRLKLARAEVKELISSLEAEGIEFADREKEIEALAACDERTRASYVNDVIRKNYKRRTADPANPVFPSVVRFGRNGSGPETEGEDFVASSPADAMLYADQVTRAMASGATEEQAREKAVKFMRSRNGKGNGGNRTQTR